LEGSKICNRNWQSAQTCLEIKGTENTDKLWVKQRAGNNLQRIELLETKIKDTFLRFVDDFSHSVMEQLLGKLEQERNNILHANEEKWRQRSRAIWVQSGDQNTKLFHHFSNHRRNRKHIWEISDEFGQVHTG
jgi:hypothetical protein